MPPVQHNIEDKVFKTLIKRYFRRREFKMVESLLLTYGLILEDRDRDFEAALNREGVTLVETSTLESRTFFACDFPGCPGGHPTPDNYCSVQRQFKLLT